MTFLSFAYSDKSEMRKFKVDDRCYPAVNIACPLDIDRSSFTIELLIGWKRERGNDRLIVGETFRFHHGHINTSDSFIFPTFTRFFEKK
jgi:hypothetical protein